MIFAFDNFLPLSDALEMRRQIDFHFANPDHQGASHQVWNYWYNDIYAYLRTDPGNVIDEGSTVNLITKIKEWSKEHLDADNVSWPWLSMYLPGCRQGWHNDATNGRWGYVYSLTSDNRRTVGGDNMVLYPDAGQLVDKANAGTGLYYLTEPKFNRLLIFADAAVHSVSVVEGSMNPQDARFVLHGHIQ